MSPFPLEDYSRITHDTRLPELEMYHSEFLEKPPNLAEQFILQLSAPTLLVAFGARIGFPAGAGNFKGVLTLKASTFFVVFVVFGLADFLRFCVGSGGVFSILEIFGGGYFPSVVTGFVLRLLKTAFVLPDVFSAPSFTTSACSGSLAEAPSATSC